MIERGRSISKVQMSALLWLVLLRGSISCFVIRWVNDNCRVEGLLLIHQSQGGGNRRAGDRKDMRISGIPRRKRLENWSKKLRFMIRPKGWVLLA